MRIIRSLSHWPHSARDCVMALGNFDGMHKGHQAVIGRAREIARAEGRPLAIMTFEPHPRRFFQPQQLLPRIVTFARKARLLREEGVDYLYVARFNAAFAQMSAQDFIDNVLLDGLHVAHVVTGHDFAFGHKRAGNVESLRVRAQEKGFRYTRVEAVTGGERMAYSSTAIRAALAQGRVEEAAAVLGRAYALEGRVMHGDKRGRSIGFPTANLRPPPHLPLRQGVYAVRMWLDGEALDGVANYGVRPTVDGVRRLLEVHVLDAAPDCYGAQVTVEFLAFIRAEKRFDGLDGLKTQIAQDIRTARALHRTVREQEQAV